MTVEVLNRQARSPSGLKVNTRLLTSLATRALELAGADTDYNLSIVLVGDSQIASLNSRFHHVEGPTDVLSFDYGIRHGELIISTGRVRTQARRFRTTPGNELTLYVVHGILHLNGYDDRTAASRRRMQARERRLIKCLAPRPVMQRLVKQ